MPERSNLFESHWSNQWLTQNRVTSLLVDLWGAGGGGGTGSPLAGGWLAVVVAHMFAQS